MPICFMNTLAVCQSPVDMYDVQHFFAFTYYIAEKIIRMSTKTKNATFIVFYNAKQLYVTYKIVSEQN
jgi:hypothetical protein